jgi:hypothetical protein
LFLDRASCASFMNRIQASLPPAAPVADVFIEIQTPLLTDQ